MFSQYPMFGRKNVVVKDYVCEATCMNPKSSSLTKNPNETLGTRLEQ